MRGAFFIEDVDALSKADYLLNCNQSSILMLLANVSFRMLVGQWTVFNEAG